MNRTFVFRADKNRQNEIDIFGDVLEFNGASEDLREWCIAHLDQSIVDAKGYIILSMQNLVVKYNNSNKK